jgi:hypothetical protein
MAFAMFVTFLWLLPDGRWTFIGMRLLAYLLLLSFNHPVEHPTDFPDVAFTLAFCGLTLEHFRVRRSKAVTAVPDVVCALVGHEEREGGRHQLAHVIERARTRRA